MRDYISFLPTFSIIQCWKKEFDLCCFEWRKRIFCILNTECRRIVKREIERRRGKFSVKFLFINFNKIKNFNFSFFVIESVFHLSSSLPKCLLYSLDSYGGFHTKHLLTVEWPTWIFFFFFALLLITLIRCIRVMNIAGPPSFMRVT